MLPRCCVQARRQCSQLIHSRVGVAITLFAREAVNTPRLDVSHVLLIRRGRDPGRGLWCFPGGKQELGESVAAAAVRECHEETGLDCTVLDQTCPAYTATDVLHHDTNGKLSYHYAIVHVLAAVSAADRLLPARSLDDADAAAWVRLHDDGAPAASDELTLRSLQRNLLVPFMTDVLERAVEAGTRYNNATTALQ